MNNKKKIIGLSLTLLAGTIFLSSCTASFCSSQDEAEILYPYDQGVTLYCYEEDLPIGVEKVLAIPGNDRIFKYVPTEIKEGSGIKLYSAKKASYLNSIIENASTAGYRVPSQEYLEAIDDFVLKASITLAYGIEYHNEDDFNSVDSNFIANLTLNDVSENKWCINPYIEYDCNGEEGTTPIKLSNDGVNGNSVLRYYGAIKFSGFDEDNTSFGFYDMWTSHLFYDENYGIDKCPSQDFIKFYKQQMATKVSSLRSCIATRDSSFGHYGTNNDWQVQISKKTWKYAWQRGFLEGLLVYPVSWLVDTFAFGMDSSLAGWSQLLALIFVTLIVRGIMLLVSFKNTMAQQKMTEIQPQLAKLQQKYPNSNTNQAERQRLAQEQMMLYKRNKINPAGTLIMALFQFPIFICVWSALQGSAALSTGSFLNLSLSDTIKDTLFNTAAGWGRNAYGWWTALVLFILMAGAQIFSMLLPQIIQKKRTSSVAKITANPAAKEQGNKTKTFMYVMMAMTIVMGFFLPSAMGVYWLIGALISIAQTLITQMILKKKRK